MAQKRSRARTEKSAPKQKTIYIQAFIGLLLVLVAAGAAAFLWQQHKHDTRPTYFTYAPEDTKSLAKLKPSDDMSADDIYQWDQQYFRLVADHKLTDVEASRVYAYLAVAQADFAALSFNAHGTLAGDVSSISHAVACEFFPDDCETLAVSDDEDAFSQQASELILARIRARRAEDKAVTKPYPLRPDANLWQAPEPRIGIDAGSRKPWHLKSSDQFRASPPPDSASATLTAQLAEVKQALAGITDKQRQAVVFWAGGPGTKTPPGIWLNIADQHMKKESVELTSVLKARADLTTAMADAVISVFDSKYTYQQKRPFMLDSSINTTMPTPNHPSYPAGHATISGAAYAVLSRHFADHEQQWSQHAAEASQSRTWGGIHFPIDNEAGLDLGKKVGNQAR